MKRREFIMLLEGAAVGWPLAVTCAHAKALDLSIPQSIMLRADEVIE